jgi:hypothetical protein
VNAAPLSFEEVVAAERRCIRRDADPNQPMSALCISGGGIRSATFALGVIQELGVGMKRQILSYLRRKPPDVHHY